jgi:hypothetical protein
MGVPGGPDTETVIQWRTSVLSLLGRVFGETSPTFKAFEKYRAKTIIHDNAGRSTTEYPIRELYAVFNSAKSEYEGGFLFDLRNLVHAEVFSDELEQAEHFLKAGYKAPAAVTAGVVLETTLRKLCETTDDVEPADKLNKMNDDLARAAVYNKMRADQVRAWAKIRNDAAHGNPDEFTETDVDLMIKGIRDFVASHLK